MSYFFWPEDLHGVDQFGVKGQALGELRDAGFLIPDWFVIPPEAFYASLTDDEYEEVMRASEGPDLPKATLTFQLSYALHQDLLKALKQLCPEEERVAVRCSPMKSALESLGGHATYESYLFVAVEDVPRAIRAVWKSGFSEGVIKARIRAQEPPLPRAPAVIIQRMIDPDAAGTAMSANPATGSRSETLVHAVSGLATLMISDPSQADEYLLDKQGGILDRKVAAKSVKHICDHAGDHGIVQVEVPPGEARIPALDDEGVQSVAALARKSASFFGRPQRIEWAREGGRLFLLQSGDIPELRSMPDPDADPGYWEFSAIAEEVRGVVTPLSYDMIRRQRALRFREVWRQLHCTDVVLEECEPLFQRVLGLVEGRVCQNLSVVQKMASLLPGYGVGSRRIASLLGPGLARLPEGERKRIARSKRRSFLAEFARSLMLREGLFKARRQSARRLRRMERRVGRLLASMGDLGELRPEEVVEHYLAVEPALGKAMAYSLLNRMMVDSWFAELTELCRQAVPEEGGAIAMTLAAVEERLPVEDAIDALTGISTKISFHEEIVEALRRGDMQSAQALMRPVGGVAEGFDAAMAAWAGSARHPSRIDQARYGEDFAPLWMAVAAGGVGSREEAGGSAERAKAAAWELLERSLEKNGGLRGKIRHALQRLRQRLAERERIIGVEEKVWGHFRRVFLELGRRLEEVDALDDTSDIFYLEKDEIFAFVHGTNTTADLKGLVAQRRREFARYRETAPPAADFVTHGMVSCGGQVPRRQDRQPEGGETKLAGLGAAAGKATGKARVCDAGGIKDLRSGDILCSSFADPAFLPYLPRLAGLVLAYASPMSRLVVLARRYGIPVVIGPPGVENWVRSGEMLEISGTNGSLRKTGSRFGGRRY